MNTALRLILFSFPLLMAVRCKDNGALTVQPKPETALPPATQTGANTFGCLVNGKPIIAGNGYAWTKATVAYERPGPHLTIAISDEGNRAFSEKTTVSISLKEVSEVGEYTVTTNLGAAISVFTGVRKNYLAWPTATIHIIRLDTTEKIISGTFECHGINEWDTTQHAEITEGRFDFRYPYHKSY